MSQNGRYDILCWIRDFLIFLVIFIVLFQVVLGVSRIDGTSMADTLQDGKTVFFLRTVRQYQVGDVVAARMGNGDLYVKRIVAQGGDVVDLRDGVLYVNGNPKAEDYAKGKTWPMVDGVEFPYTVKEGRFFLMGDNRERSEDSRMFGALPTESLQGRLFGCN